MFAVIEVGAKQYLIKKGDIIEVEKLQAEKDEDVTIDKVLLLSKDKACEIGKPYLKDVKVIATLLDQFKGKKVVSFKYRRRKASHTKRGHRQHLSRLKIKDIKSG